jgi:hypothetical protein
MSCSITASICSVSAISENFIHEQQYKIMMSLARIASRLGRTAGSVQFLGIQSRRLTGSIARARDILANRATSPVMESFLAASSQHSGEALSGSGTAPHADSIVSVCGVERNRKSVCLMNESAIL